MKEEWGKEEQTRIFRCNMKRRMGIWKLRVLRREIERAICLLRRENEN
jgi:hypothetical protein